MGKPSKTRSKKNSAAQDGAEADVGSGGTQQPATNSPCEQQQGQGAADRPVRVYADGKWCVCGLIKSSKLEAQAVRLCQLFHTLCAAGIFDMFHFGHARALEQAKKM
jgi:hypothetical protein